MFYLRGDLFRMPLGGAQMKEREHQSTRGRYAKRKNESTKVRYSKSNITSNIVLWCFGAFFLSFVLSFYLFFSPTGYFFLFLGLTNKKL